MPWPISTSQTSLCLEKDAANEFLKVRNLPLINDIKFIDEEDFSCIQVNNGQYFIDHRTETVMMKNLRGTYPYPVEYLCAYHVDEPMDPQEVGGRTEIYEQTHFGSLSSFLVRIALETVFSEWRNRGY
jgi:hypothetical protein